MKAEMIEVEAGRGQRYSDVVADSVSSRIDMPLWCESMGSLE